MNPRYLAFKKRFPNGKNWEFINWIGVNLKEFAKTKGFNHTPLSPLALDLITGEEFTEFLNNLS